MNRAWRERVSTTLEWTALEWVCVDSPGFLQLISERCERRPPLRERVESELRNFAILLEEDLGKYSATSKPRWPVIEGLGSVRSVRSRRSRKSASRELDSEVSSSSGRSCRKTEWISLKGSFGREIEESEDEIFEEYAASSLDSSMMVWYPRHFRRV